MRYLLIIASFLITFSASAKEKKAVVDMKEDTVMVDGKASFLFEKVKYLPGTFNYFVRDFNNKKLAFLKFYEFNDPKEISSANPKCRITYYEVTFIESNQKAEIPAFARQVKMAEFLVKQNLVQNGTISEESEEEFIMVNGTPFSKQRDELNGNTIIINNNNSTPSRNGINININKEDD